MKCIYIFFMVIFQLFFYVGLYSQYTIEQAVKDAKKQAAIGQLGVIIDEEINLYNSNSSHNWLPQINIIGQASYQSQTTGLNLDFPGVNIPRLSKDQYKVQGEISQVLYDGGLTNVSKSLKTINGNIEKNSIRLELEELEKQCIQLFFQIKELEIRQEIISNGLMDINATSKKLKSGVDNGIVLKSELAGLEAEKIKIQQQETELKSMVNNQREILYLLTGNTAAKVEDLISPALLAEHQERNIKSTVMKQFDLQKQNVMTLKLKDEALLKPKIGAYGTLGYGKPGLNFLENKFQPYYIVGLRAQWELSGFYNANNNRQINKLLEEKVEIRRSASTTKITLMDVQLKNDVLKLNEFLIQDDQMIDLRNSIKKISNLQVENGAITTSEYILKLNDYNDALLNKELHNLYIQKAKYLINHNNGWTN